MRSVFWSAEALNDFDDQINYISLRSQKNAALVADRIEAAVVALQSAPTGRFGRVTGTYEKLVSRTSLIIAYSLGADDAINIVRIIHAARDWPDENWPSD